MAAILGISAFFHDAAAALVVDGRVVAAAQEERFSRRKHDAEFPARAVAACLAEGGLTAAGLDWVGFYDKPLLKFERLLETYLARAPVGLASFRTALPAWLQAKLFLPGALGRALDGYERRVVFAEHHESHAASAFYPSPFGEAAILVVDGVGEWSTASLGSGRGGRIDLTQRLRFPHSLGLLYSAMTAYLGFRVNGGEYKVMGLAPYGEPRQLGLLRDHLIDLKADGSFRLDMSYFRYDRGLTMTAPKLHRLLGGPPREREAPIGPREMDLAASLQALAEEILLRMARHVQRATGMSRLCLAGGVALNAVANGRVLREGPFEELWVQPAAGDAGGALGVALLIEHRLLGRPRSVVRPDGQGGSRLGPAYSDAAIGRALRAAGAVSERLESDEALCEAVADRLARGEVVAWFQGRMEFGPRALGSRSILADPRDPEMRSRINQKIKFREGFRPFAPAVLRDRAAEFFGLDAESPYMLIVAPVRGAGVAADDRGPSGFGRLDAVGGPVPAVTHVDGSARVQTVDPARDPLLDRLIRAFERRTGCPMVVNTSFNVRGEPIVAAPIDALRAFRATGLDALAIGHHLLSKADQPPATPGEADAHRARFPLD